MTAPTAAQLAQLTGTTQDLSVVKNKAVVPKITNTPEVKIPGPSPEQLEQLALGSLTRSYEQSALEVGQQESRQQAGESNSSFFMRSMSGAVQRGQVNSLDAVLPDDAVDAMRGVNTRGTDPNKPFVFNPPSQLMPPTELREHRNWIRNTFRKGEEPQPIVGEDLTAFEEFTAASAAGVEAASDITNIARAPFRILANMTQSILPGAAADTGVRYMMEVAEEQEWSDATKLSMALATGITSASAIAVAQAPIAIAYTGYKKAKLLDVESSMSHLNNRQAQTFAKVVAESQDNFPEIVAEAMALQERFNTDLSIIRVAGGLQNTIMKDEFVRLYSDPKNTKYRAEVDASINQFIDFQEKNRKLLVGAGQSDILPDVAFAVNKEQRKRTVDIDKRNTHFKDQIKEVDTKLARLTLRLTASKGKTEVGFVAQNLLDEKWELARKSVNPQYEALKESATSAGVRMSSESTASLVSSVNNLPENWGKFFDIPNAAKVVPARTKTISSLENGGVVSARSLTDVTEPKKVTRTEEFTPADVMSLKNKVNKALRAKNLSADDALLLGQFKRKLSAEIDKMPGDFGAKLKAIDLQRYEVMGVPFDSVGVSQMNSTKFFNTVSRNLTNVQKARDFIQAVGVDGIPVLKDAIYAQIDHMAVRGSGVANPAKVNAWLSDKDNIALVNMVPGLSEELKSTSEAIMNAKSVKARIESDFAANAYQATDDFLKITRKQGIGTFVNNMLRSENSVTDFNDVLKTLSPDSQEKITSGIRSALLDKAIGASSKKLTKGETNPSVTFMNNNRPVFDAFFGRAYTPFVEDALSAYDLINQTGIQDIRTRANISHGELFEAQTGVGASTIQSQIRQTSSVKSPITAAAFLGSKAGQFRMDVKRDMRLMDVLRDPEGVKELAEAYRRAKKAGWKGKSMTALKAIGENIARRTLRGSYIGAKEGSSSRLTQEDSPEQQQMLQVQQQQQNLQGQQ